ncbi:hypothetical protein [Rhodococcus sp. KBW08]|uniref:hypothetical protein n=1 Tax=Rhodococcus sp. KBW08 TaxID=2144188 RepID=UPI000F5A42D3|nr:hypothetical protein [Rhodococcus sp. KBW08]
MVRRAWAEPAEQFETELGKHPDGPIPMSLPGVGCRTSVTMLVEISESTGSPTPAICRLRGHRTVNS